MFHPALQQAVLHHSAGRLREAEELYRQILAIEPNHVEAIQRLGILAQQSGRGQEALDLLRRAMALSPNAADSHANLGAALASQGQFQQAVQPLRRAASIRPDLPQLRFHLANALRQAGQLDEAVSEYQQTLALEGNHAEALNNLGVALHDLNRTDEALEAYRRAIVLRPDWAEAHNNLASVLHRRGELHEAIDEYRQAIKLAPNLPDSHNNLSAALLETGAISQALTEAQAARALRTSDPAILFNLANALRQIGRPGDAIETYQRALALQPNYPEAFYNLGSALKDMGSVDDAIAAYRQAIALRPKYGEAYSNLAAALRDKGELDESIACYRQAAELTELPWVAGNLLYTLHFHPDYDSRRLFEEHLSWNERYAKQVEASTLPFDRDRIEVHGRPTDRRLRVGYISCDFRNHPVGRFMLPLLSNHDRDQFEVHCYSDTVRTDSFTEELRCHPHSWHNTLGLNDERFAALVREAEIDILVDLSMHARTGRMMALARKPAPVQVSYLAYCSTSGLRTMDYRLSDSYLDPPGSDESVYFEKTIRLRSYWCYPGAPFEMPVAPLPALAAGHVTFGCLNVYAKVTRSALLTWFEILREVPNSRLLIHALEGNHRDRAVALGQTAGVDPARIEFIGFMPGARYFEQYGRIDIGLDPFPYAGGTTTCDALWMGVPVISLSGATAVSRGGLSILSHVNLSHWVTDDRSRYVQLAVELANNLDRLGDLRSTLRERMLGSPLMDAPAFVRDVESAYRQMWGDPRRK